MSASSTQNSWFFRPYSTRPSLNARRVGAAAWRRLHRLVYPAAVLTFLHWVLAAFDPMTAYIHIAVLAVIELVRVALQYRQRVT